MKKKIIIISSIVIVAILIISLIIYFNVRIVVDNSGFTLKDDLTVNVYSNVKVKDFIKDIDGKVVDNNKIKTTELGKVEVEFIYLNSDEKKRKGVFEVEVKDLE